MDSIIEETEPVAVVPAKAEAMAIPTSEAQYTGMYMCYCVTELFKNNIITVYSYLELAWC